MTKIQELLDNLLHKKLGRDVRQSIHDSIEQCYEDATGHPDSVAAVIKENKEMQEHLDNKPYMTVEEGESADLPVHTINDDEIGVASTWSSECINGKIKTIDEKIQEVFQNASNGKSKLATAIGNGASADMTWDQLASKVLHVNYQKKSGENGVYFDKAFNTVLLWAVAGANYGEDRTGCIIANGLADGNDKINIMPMDSGSDTSYSLVNNGNQLFAQTHSSNATHNTCYYYCYQVGYN